jgi:hypothetical protein
MFPHAVKAGLTTAQKAPDNPHIRRNIRTVALSYHEAQVTFTDAPLYRGSDCVSGGEIPARSLGAAAGRARNGNSEQATSSQCDSHVISKYYLASSEVA